MEIILIGKNNLTKDTTPTPISVEVNPDDNIIEVCHRIKNVGAKLSFNNYYPRCTEMISEDSCFPFMIINGVVEWNVPCTKVSIAQFFDTHNGALKDGIVFEYGYSMAGGPDWLPAWDIIQLWAPIIWHIAVTLGEANGVFKSVQSIILWFKNKFGITRKMPYPQSYSDFIFSRDFWNHYDLAKQLNIDAEQAKEFLKAYGYKWDITKHAYIVNKNIKCTLIEKENNIISHINI